MTERKCNLWLVLFCTVGFITVTNQSVADPTDAVTDAPASVVTDKTTPQSVESGQVSAGGSVIQDRHEANNMPDPVISEKKQQFKLQADIKRIAEKQAQLTTRLDQWFASADGIEDKVMQIGLSTFDVTQQIQNSALTQLAILLAVAALGMTYGYFDVKARLTDSVESRSRKIIEVERQKIEADFLNKDIRSRLTTQTAIYQSLSFTAWEQYKDIDFFKEASEYRRNVQNAIILSERALAHANEMTKLDGGNEEENEIAVIQAKNNLAYHLASKCMIDDSDDDKLKLLSLAKEVFDFGKQNKTTNPDHWYNWVETYIYACKIVGEDHQKVLAKAELQTLLNDSSVDKKWANEIAHEYKDFLSSDTD